MQQSAVAVTTRVGLKRAFDVDLPLNAATLNEHLYDIGIWLIERHIPHQARILWEPLEKRIRVSFYDPDEAGAFRKRFGATLH